MLLNHKRERKMTCFQAVGQGVSYTGNTLFNIVKIPYRLSKLAAVNLTPNQRLPNETKISHFARESLAFTSKILIPCSFIFTAKALMPVATSFIGFIGGICVFVASDQIAQALPQKIQKAALKSFTFLSFSVMAFSAYTFAVQLTLKGFLGIVSFIAFNQLFQVARNNNPAAICIGENETSLDDQTLSDKLQEIIQTGRQIKSLEIRNNGPHFSLSQAHFESLKQIRMETVILNGVNFAESTLEDFNKSLNQNSNAEKMTFYYLEKANSGSHSYTLKKTVTSPNCCEIGPSSEAPMTNTSIKLESYLKQFCLIKELHWSAQDVEIKINNPDKDGSVVITASLLPFILALNPQSIDFESASTSVLEHLNKLSNSSYYRKANRKLVKTSDTKFYTVGYGEKLTNDTIKNRLVSIRGQNVQSIRIINPEIENEELILSQEVIDLLAELKPQTISLQYCKISDDHLLQINKSLNQDPSVDSIFIYAPKSHSIYSLSENCFELEKVKWDEGCYGIKHFSTHQPLQEFAVIVHGRTRPIQTLLFNSCSQSVLDDQTITYLQQINPKELVFNSGEIPGEFLTKLFAAFPQARITTVNLSYHGKLSLQLW